jgi:hypothetical protein
MYRRSRRRLEARYDGPVPPEALTPPAPFAALKRRLTLHLDFLIEYGGQARHQIVDGRSADADRSRRHMIGARRAVATIGGDVRRALKEMASRRTDDRRTE